MAGETYQFIPLRVRNVDCYAATTIQLRLYVNLRGIVVRLHRKRTEMQTFIDMWPAKAVYVDSRGVVTRSVICKAVPYAM